MCITSPEELAGLRRAGEVAASVRETARAAVRPGITTRELDEIAAEAMTRLGARSAPKLVYGFPGAICISVNEEAVHGIPGPRVLRDGDLVKLDVTVELEGFYADTAVSVPVGAAQPELERLCTAGRSALTRAVAVATAGLPLCQLGRTIEEEVARHGCSVLPMLTGHGIGHTIHESPTVPQHWDPMFEQQLCEGQVIAVEPIICLGGRGVRDLDDGWTVATADGTVSAHFEHTMMVTQGRPVVLTNAPV
jgi:methionyl aminopeptidase